MLKKSIMLILSTAYFSTASWATDLTTQKITTIKSMYQQDKTLHKGNDLLVKYADLNFKKALQLQSKFARQGTLCGVDYDVLWQSQDPNYHTKLNYSSQSNGQIKVRLGHSSVSYSLICNQNHCQITDAYDHSGSVKQTILRECH